MRLYFDCCCYNRPFEDQSQNRIHDESDAILSLINRCQKDKLGIILGSTVLKMEIDQISDPAKKVKVLSLSKAISENIVYNDIIKKRAIEIQALTSIHEMDSLHIASAEFGNADIFISTDDKLLKSCQKIKTRLKVRVKNPVSFLAEVIENDGY